MQPPGGIELNQTNAANVAVTKCYFAAGVNFRKERNPKCLLKGHFIFRCSVHVGRWRLATPSSLRYGGAKTNPSIVASPRGMCILYG